MMSTVASWLIRLYTVFIAWIEWSGVDGVKWRGGSGVVVGDKVLLD